MVRAKLKTPEGRKFLLALLVVFMIAAAGVGRATIVGVIEQYNIPLSEWTTSMYVLQSAMICVYSLVFTVLLAIPLGIFFLGDRESIKPLFAILKPACGLAFFMSLFY
jgi:ABC-type spermidine/putrescine transport system permease subunit I